MRTPTSISVLVCVAGVVFITRDARALLVTFDQAPGKPSITDPAGLPPNLVVSPDLDEVVSDMLRESETFRRQVSIIGRRQSVRVRIVLEDPPGGTRPVRAQCDLSRYDLGAITALVHVWSRGDAIELIAHELEHVIEFAEGVNYRAQALGQRGPVWASNGAFETARAIETGLQVKSEMPFAIAQTRR